MTEATRPIKIGNLGRDLAGFTMIAEAWRAYQEDEAELVLNMEACQDLPATMLPCLGLLVARIRAETTRDTPIESPHWLLVEELPSPVVDAPGVRIGRWLDPEELAAFRRKTPSGVACWRRFELGEGVEFAAFMDAAIAEIPENSLPAATTSRLSPAALELFQNAFMHSQSMVGVLVGVDVEVAQRRLSLTVVDGGVGFGGSLRASHGNSITDARALRLVIERQASARRSSSGGIGLSVVRDLMAELAGTLIIVTGGAMWDGMSYATLEPPFPGTAVCLDITWPRLVRV